jgi:MAF protein
VKNISNRTQGLPVENDRSSPWLLIRIRRFKAVMALLGGSVLLQRTIAPAMSRAFVYLASQSPRRQQRVQRRGLPAAPLLSADTTVAIGRTILGKPADADEASAMLARLSGRWHRVVSGVAVAHGARSSLALNVSRVRFAKLPRVAIEAYVASGEPFGKAGAYAIQSALAGWIERIDGSHSGIMGLPLFETAQLLRRAGVPTALSE